MTFAAPPYTRPEHGALLAVDDRRRLARPDTNTRSFEEFRGSCAPAMPSRSDGNGSGSG
jgi:hypothetical protein